MTPAREEMLPICAYPKEGVSFMSIEDNKALARQAYEMLNQRNLALAGELYAPDIVDHNASRNIQGIDAFKQFLSMYLTASPDLHFTIEDQVAEGDKVATRYMAGGTHLGPFMGIPPTGKHVIATGMSIIRVANGKIVEEWANGDDLGLLQQLGVVPAPGQPG
jgi:steroid delta-isomerase-like uncharacterized protein